MDPCPKNEGDSSDVEALAATSASVTPAEAPRTDPRDRPAGLPSDFPERIAEYQILAKLGHGAMGSVFEAHDKFLDRRVAIKFINTMALSPEAHERFLREARAIARLHHPNIIVVHRIGQHDDRWYLVSELVRGQSLDKLEKPVPADRLIRLARELARGLGAAHRRGVLHRDIKPANAILADTGEVKLLDFGLAKLLQPSRDGEPPPELADSLEDLALSPALTQAGSLMGTPLYMAPEVLRWQPATTRSDIYSLGAMLYELASGSKPYKAASVLELAFLVQEKDPRPLHELAPSLPSAFTNLIERCLRRDPAARPASCEELCQILDGLLSPADRPKTAPLPEGNPYRGLRPFEAEHRSLFFGRQTEIEELLDRLRGDAMVLLCGDSGVGKSSLVRAGILPAVAEGALRGGRLWTTVSLTPGPRPLATLADMLAALCNLSETEVASRICDDPGSVIQALVKGQGEQRGVTLFIDQLEELVTQGDRSEAKRVAEFLGHMGALVPGVRLLMTGRIDFLARLAALPGLGRELEKSIYIVRPLSEEGLREAVTGPAARLGFSYETDEMIEELVQSSVAAEGGLPLLQFALSELWRSRDQEGHVIPARALQQIGGVTGALARHADAVVGDLQPGQRAAARRLLSRLITEEGTRATRTLAELVGDNDADGQAALEALVRGRLLVAREAADGVGTYEIAHEALLAGWDTLRRWLVQDAEDRAARQRLDRAAAEWVRLKRAREGLWNDRQLQELSPSLLSGLSAQESEFVRASQQSVRRRRWIWRGSLAAIPVLLLLVYGGVQVKIHRDLQHRVQSHVAEARDLLSQAREEKRRLEQLQEQAFTRFRDRDPQGGERIWQQAVDLFPEAEGRFREANRAAEAALVLDRSGPATKKLFAEILYDQALLLDSATAPYGRAQQEDLIQRLQTYDDGTFRRRLYQPGRIDLSTSPPGAMVASQQYVEQRGIYELRAPRPLGRTPLSGVSLPPGSYLLSLSAPGRTEVRYPLLVGRGERLDLSVPIPASVPPGYVYVPPGRFLYGAGSDEALRRIYGTVQPQHAVTTEGYLIGRTEVTFGDWLRYVQALPPQEQAERLPHGGGQQRGTNVSVRKLRDGKFELSLEPAGTTFVLKEGERLVYPVRTRHQSHDWLHLPVVGISYADAVAYAGWLHKTGVVRGARLCSEYEWERAARGADGRMLPHGSVLRPDDADIDVTYGREPRSFGPDEVGSHPASDSPFGVADLAGNVWEWTQSVVSDREVVYRGGGWYQGVASARSINREFGETTMRTTMIGLRICASVPAE